MASASQPSPIRTANGFTVPPGVLTFTTWGPCVCKTNTGTQIAYRYFEGKWARSNQRACTCDSTPSTQVTPSRRTWPPSGQTTQPSVFTTSTPVVTPSTRNPNVITTSSLPSGTTTVGPITPSLAGDTDKTALIIGGVLGAAVAILIIIILLIVLIYRRKTRSRTDDNSKDCFDFCKKKKQPDFMNEPTYTPPEILPRPPGITATNITDPTYNIDNDDPLVDYGHHVYETLPDNPVVISRRPLSRRPVTEAGDDQLALPRVFTTASDPSGYSHLATSHGPVANNAYLMRQNQAVTDGGRSRYETLIDPPNAVGSNTRSSRYQHFTNSAGPVTDHPLPVSHGSAVTGNRPPGYDHLTGQQLLRQNNDTGPYNHLSGTLSPTNARPNHYTPTAVQDIPEYLELEDPGIVETSAPSDFLNRQRHVPVPTNPMYYVLRG